MYKTFNEIAYENSINSETSIVLKAIQPLEFTNNAYEFNINYKNKTLKQPLWFSHLTMLGLLHCEFQSVLDLGAGDGMASHILNFLDKDVTALEGYNAGPRIPEVPAYNASILGNYLDVKFDKKFDAIWCSHVLEHTRNPGFFLDKIFHDLNDNGILALTVPFNDMIDDLSWCCFGHYTKYTHSLLVYHLISSGFDCKNINLANYSGQIGVILKKKNNNLEIIDTAHSGPMIKQFLPPEMEYTDVGNGTWSIKKYYNWIYPKLSDKYDLGIFKN